jgi:adenylate cyclase, class 2
MAQEIEVVFLEINKEKIEKKLAEIGAQKVGDIFYRHIAFDYPDYRLEKENSWIRLRDEGDKIILAFKKRLGVSSQDGSTNDEGMEEIEVKVDSYENTALFLQKIGFIQKHQAEKKRTHWRKGETFFDIDTWPEIPTFLEIEAPSWEAITSAVGELGLDPKDQKIFSVNQVYKIYKKDVNDYKKISFSGSVKNY